MRLETINQMIHPVFKEAPTPTAVVITVTTHEGDEVASVVTELVGDVVE